MINSKHEIRNSKQIKMIKIKNTKLYDLEERTFNFAKNVREFLKKLPKSIFLYEDINQLTRSSGSVGANYIEANESLSKKDFIMRIKICRKEAKESKYWLQLINCNDNLILDKERLTLIQESIELTNIFGAIVRKSE